MSINFFFECSFGKLMHFLCHLSEFYKIGLLPLDNYQIQGFFHYDPFLFISQRNWGKDYLYRVNNFSKFSISNGAYCLSLSPALFLKNITISCIFLELLLNSINADFRKVLIKNTLNLFFDSKQIFYHLIQWSFFQAVKGHKILAISSLRFIWGEWSLSIFLRYLFLLNEAI